MQNSLNTITVNDLFIPVGLYTVLAITIFIYWPGLNSTFMYDDIANFQILTQLNQTDTYSRIIQFILTGNSGPTGRPISLLSFMINDQAWPSNPWSFKYTNLMIHLMNGVLVFLMVNILGKLIRLNEYMNGWIALFTASLFLLHPIQVSTVLNVIQRMTQLSALFSLAAIVVYLSARKKIQSEPIKSYFKMSLGLIFFVSLAVLSKENGILVILYLITIEYLLIRPLGDPPPPLFKYWSLTFLWLPSSLLTIYLLSRIPGLISGSSIWDFTLIERLMTEARVIADYLFNIIIPKLGYSGLFHDDYSISTNIISPPQTIIAIIFLGALVFTAIVFRKKNPIYSFSVTWYLCGHILESTIIPLEIYYEHRNYLPIVGPVFGLTYTVAMNRDKFRNIILISSIAVFAIAILSTKHNTWLWGNPVYAAPIWASEHPKSVRAQQYASSIEALKGNYDNARQYLMKGLKHNPADSGLILQVIAMDCQMRTLDKQQLNASIKALSSAKYTHASITEIINISNLAMQNTCKPLNNQIARKMFKSLIKNPDYKGSDKHHALHYWLGQLYANDRMLSDAIVSLDISHQHMSVIDIPLQQAVWLASAGLYDEALTYIQRAEAMDKRSRNPLLKYARKKDISNLKELILEAKATNRLKQ